nr:class I SAM-dependent methyltransferase [Salinivibrio sp. PR5]
MTSLSKWIDRIMTYCNTVKSSVHYYNEHAATFIFTTQKVDMSNLYQQLTPLLPVGAAILDAGCGSGRDALNFKKMGFDVEAFDASKAMSEAASQLVGHKVHCCTFMEFSSQKSFDAIWACASLLHVPHKHLPETFEHLAQFLSNEGKFIVSFKYGDSERQEGERHFTDMNEERFEQVIRDVGGLTIRKTWLTSDNRPQNETMWFNAILHKL